MREILKGDSSARGSHCVVFLFCLCAFLLGFPSAGTASEGSTATSGACLIEPWECKEASEGELQVCHGEFCSYIVVFWDWIEDPAAVAHEQVEKYEGKLGFVYKNALKGYSAEYRTTVVSDIACEPTVKYVEKDQIVEAFNVSSSGQVASSPNVFECENKEPEPKLTLAVDIEEGNGTVVSSPGGIECGATCAAGFEGGAKVTLTASPSPGYTFKGWRHCDTGGVDGRQCTMKVSSSKGVGAKFVKTWNLQAAKSGSGLGKVQTSPGGIACLYSCTQAEAAFKEGSVTVKQAAATHNHFVQWLGNCEGSAETCLLSMNEDHEVEAEFAPDPQYVLRLAKEGGGQGSVKTKPSGIICGLTCNASAASFYAGEAVSVSVKLGEGTTKLTWASGAGTCIGSTEALESNCTVEMDEVHSLVAKFD